MPELKCPVCGDLFHVEPMAMKLSLRKTCSMKCKGISSLRGETRECASCGKQFYVARSIAKRRLAIYCSNSCSQAPKKKDKVAGGGGYVWVHCPGHSSATNGGLAPEHRLVAEAKIGRPIVPGEVVHHLDRDKKNNNAVNLLVLSRAEHLLVHRIWIKEEENHG